MRKFLRACHIISRIFIFLIMAAILLLYFIRPDTLGFLNTGAAADGIFWEVFATTFSMAAVMFAASDWAYRSMEDNDYLVTLSSSILRPCYEEHDLSDKRYTKAAAADEWDFNANLRDVTDQKERVLQELAWEKKNNKRLKSRANVNGIVSLFFFVAALFFLAYPIIIFLTSGQLLALPDGSFMPYFTTAAVILTVLIVYDNTSYRNHIRRLNTILSIRSRNDELHNAPASLPAPAHPAPSASAHAPVPVSQPVPAPAPIAPAPAPAPVQETPMPETPEPVIPDEEPVPAEPVATESIFESLEPEEDSPEY